MTQFASILVLTVMILITAFNVSLFVVSAIEAKYLKKIRDKYGFQSHQYGKAGWILFGLHPFNVRKKIKELKNEFKDI